MALLTGVALLSAGLIASAILGQEVTERVDADLHADVAEFERLTEVGVDPSTGATFASPESAVRTAMARTIPDPNEGIVGFLNGSLEWVSRDAILPLEDDPELVAAVAPLTQKLEVTYTTIGTANTEYHVAVAPVSLDSSGALNVGSAASGEGEVGTVAALVLAYDLRAELGLFQHAFEIYALVALVAWVIVSSVAWLLAGRLLHPIATLAQTASRIGRDDLSERIPVRGNDDVSAMTTSVNDMLDRVQSAMNAQSHLLNDVSHELKTPITVVRGHLELMDVHDPADAQDVRDLGIEELDRMAALVSDLLTLAKADRPDFVTVRSTNITSLTDSVFDKARTLGDRRWIHAGSAIAWAQIDPERVTQAWLQLAANAVKFSTDASPIEIGSSATSASVRFWVTDHGQGVPPQDHQRIFERFTQSQAHRKEGSGLGLSIVSAIVNAHSGHVELESSVGAGSTFSMVLPLRAPHSTTTGGHP